MGLYPGIFHDIPHGLLVERGGALWYDTIVKNRIKSPEVEFKKSGEADRRYLEV